MQNHGTYPPHPKTRSERGPKQGSSAIEPPYRRSTDLCLGHIGNVELRVPQGAFPSRNLILGNTPAAHGLWAALAFQEARIRAVLLVGSSPTTPDIVAWAVAYGCRCLPVRTAAIPATSAVLLAPPCAPSRRRESAGRRPTHPGSTYVAVPSNGAFEPPDSPSRWRQVILIDAPTESLQRYNVLADLRASGSQTVLNTAPWPTGSAPITLPTRSLPPLVATRLMAREPLALAAHLRRLDRCSGDIAIPNA